jgi:hypothetical protein
MPSIYAKSWNSSSRCVTAVACEDQGQIRAIDLAVDATMWVIARKDCPCMAENNNK